MSADAPADTTAPTTLSEGGAASVRAGVTSGQRWRDAYLVGATFGEPEGRWFEATQLANDRAVWLRVSRDHGTGRGQLWEKLAGIEHAHVQRALEVHPQGDRVEVWSSPGTTSLRGWRALRGAPSEQDIATMVEQISSALETLHLHGVGHFSISPDTIFVRDSGGPVQFVLAHFDRAAAFGGPDLVPIAVDPLYAPPEAAGLFKHSPGPLLTAWDCWSLGRTVQEWMLGHPVMALLPEDIAAKLPRETPGKAEAMLFEREVGLLRPGGVELMKDLEPRTDLLLRGLLTTVREARWTIADVQTWLTGDSPKERYGMSRTERLFRWQGHGYTLQEAAQLFRGPQHWKEAVAHVFSDKSGSFGHFLANELSHREAFERWKTTLALAESPALKPWPPELVREIVAFVALHELSGGDFMWRGQVLSGAVLRNWLGGVEDRDVLRSELRALAAPPVLRVLQTHDTGVAGILEQLVKCAGDAEGVVVRNRWNSSSEPRDLTALWLLSLETDQGLAERIEKLRRDFARSEIPGMQQIFALPHPARSMQVVLAWVARNPPRGRFITHEEMKRLKLAELEARARLVGRVLFWRRLQSALRAGTLVFGEKWLLVAGWLAVVPVLAVHRPGPIGLLLGAGPIVLLAVLRTGLNFWQARLVRKWSPDSERWGWGSGRQRCAREASRLADEQGLPAHTAALVDLINQIEAEMRSLAVPGADSAATVAWPPRQLATWAASALSWVAIGALLLGSIAYGVKHPPPWAEHTATWAKILHLKVEKKIDELNVTKISWPYKPPTDPYEVTIKGSFVPTAAQEKAAIARGKQLVAAYKPETITDLVAIYVPVERDSECGLLLFDGRKGTLFGRTAVRLNFVPLQKMWLQIGDTRAIFIEK